MWMALTNVCVYEKHDIMHQITILALLTIELFTDQFLEMIMYGHCLVSPV